MLHRHLGPLVRTAVLALLPLWGCSKPGVSVGDHLARGEAALADGRYAMALAACNHARELAPTDPGVQQALMRARLHLLADDPARLATEASDDARYEALLMIESDKPKAAVYLTALANVMARQGDLEGAKLKLAEALKQDPASPLAHTALAGVYLRKREDSGRAKAELEAALKARPDHTRALVMLGELRLAEGDLPGAVDRLETALRASDDFSTRMALGNARVQQRKLPEAIEHFQRATQIDPRSADALSALGQALVNAGKPAEAERPLRAALQIRADSPTLAALGFSLLRQQKPEPALSAFRQALTDDPSSPPALLGAGLASEALGRRDDAVDLYRRLLSPQGPARDGAADLQREAQSRLSALSAPASSASAPASSAPASGRPPAGSPPRPGAQR